MTSLLATTPMYFLQCFQIVYLAVKRQVHINFDKGRPIWTRRFNYSVTTEPSSIGESYFNTNFSYTLSINMDQPSVSSNRADMSESKDANNVTCEPAARSRDRGQKTRRGDARGGGKTRGARGGRNKRSDMGRAEWKYGICTILLCPFSLINKVVPR